MATATLTSKGQVVIPKSVRDRLSLHAGDQLDFLVQNNGELLVRPAVYDVADLYGVLFEPGRKPVSLDGMKQAVRRRAAQKGNP